MRLFLESRGKRNFTPNEKAPPKFGGAFGFDSECLAAGAFYGIAGGAQGVADGIFGFAQRGLAFALEFLHFAFGFQVGVACQVAGSLFDPANCLIACAARFVFCLSHDVASLWLFRQKAKRVPEEENRRQKTEAEILYF